MGQEYMVKKEAAAALGVSERTLDRWHSLRKGPPRIKVGQLIIYRREAFDQWLRANETQPVNAP